MRNDAPAIRMIRYAYRTTGIGGGRMTSLDPTYHLPHYNLQLG